MQSRVFVEFCVSGIVPIRFIAIISFVSPLGIVCFLIPIGILVRAQRLINLEIPVLVRSLKSSNVELG